MMNGEIGFVAHLLQIFADHGISFEHCPSGIDTVSIIVSTEALAPARERRSSAGSRTSCSPTTSASKTGSPSSPSSARA